MIMLNETDYSDPSMTGSAALPTSSSLPGESGYIGGHLDVNGPPPCTGCGQAILDQFILKVQGRLWHAACLRCAACHVTLTRDCFLRGAQVFCQDDFFRLFGARCTGCNQPIPPTEQVRRAHEKIYHPACFKCIGCDVELNTGDEFYLRDDGKLICRQDYDIAKEKEYSDSESEPSPKRARIFLSDHQKTILEALFNHCRHPSHKILTIVASEIELELRTVQKWFKNKRAEDSLWSSEGELTDSELPVQKTGTFPVPIVNKEFSGNFASRQERTNRTIRNNSDRNNTISHWSMSDDMWSPDFVPPNIELTAEDLKDGEVCSDRNMRKSAGRNVMPVRDNEIQNGDSGDVNKNCLGDNFNWVDCPN